MVDLTTLTNQAEVAICLTAYIADAIRQLGSVPSGRLFARLMKWISLDTYTKIIHALKEHGLVSESHHVLTWIGQQKYAQVSAEVIPRKAEELMNITLQIPEALAAAIAEKAKALGISRHKAMVRVIQDWAVGPQQAPPPFCHLTEVADWPTEGILDELAMLHKLAGEEEAKGVEGSERWAERVIQDTSQPQQQAPQPAIGLDDGVTLAKLEEMVLEDLERERKQDPSQATAGILDELTLVTLAKLQEFMDEEKAKGNASDEAMVRRIQQQPAELPASQQPAPQQAELRYTLYNPHTESVEATQFMLPIEAASRNEELRSYGDPQRWINTPGFEELCTDGALRVRPALPKKP
jgi:Ribbon-helix-helix protein, copG family